MEVKDLMIGNYIFGEYYDYSSDEESEKEEVCRVLSLDSVDAMEYPIWVEGESSSVEVYSNFKPIPLTEEWFINFGFTGDNGRYEIDYFNKDYNIDCTAEYEYGNFTKKYHQYETCKAGVGCKYVHELQNLHFCRTGEELTLNKKP